MRSFWIMILMMITSLMAKAQSPEGTWEGTLKVQEISLRLMVNIKKGDTGFTATLDSPDQGAYGIPISTISIENKTLDFKITNLGVQYQGKLNEKGDEINGTFQQGGGSFPLLFKLKIEEVVFKRPQHPKPPFPYQEEMVKYDNPVAKGVTLAGTLTLPKGDGPHPAVILISGSGPQDRNEEILDHKPFLVIADHFTRNGIAVLRYDDRGVAQSTGDFAKATSADFATDVQAGIKFLKSRKDIHAEKIGLVGHSEGGIIAPMVASQSPDVAFAVLMAGPGVSGTEILLLQQRLIGRAQGLDEATLDEIEKANKKTYKKIKKTKNLEKTLTKIKKKALKEVEDSTTIEAAKTQIDQNLKQLSSPWYRYFLKYDPATSLEKTTCPVLAINGEKDLQVDADQNLPAIEKALKKAGNTRFKTVRLPGLNHLFQKAETGAPAEYKEIEETFSADVLRLMTEWINEQVGDK